MADRSQALASPSAWEEPDRAARLLPRLPEETGLAPRDAQALLRLCEESADPDGALAGAVRALGARRARLGRPASPAALQPLVTVCAASRYLADHLAARPRLLDLLPMLSGMTRTASETLATGFRLANAPDAEAFARGLRRHKLVEMLRIALRDLTGRAPLPESARELSFLASSVLEAAVRFHYRRLCAQHGAPEGRTAAGPSGFCVLGMGKLGGTELNFSSDVDLLYVYDRDGRTQGPQAIDHFAFYARLAEEVTRAVGAMPFVFRVDLDLRPEGRSGPIVNSLRALELYYEAQGAPWERFALIKALPVAGDLPVGEEALRRLVPFVWRKYLDLGAVEEMRALKARAEREAGRRGKQDLKLGPGGIREVEFFVQALQLLHGGKDKNLRARGTLPALERLLFAGFVDLQSAPLPLSIRTANKIGVEAGVRADPAGTRTTVTEMDGNAIIRLARQDPCGATDSAAAITELDHVAVDGAMLTAGVADPSTQPQSIGGSRTYDNNVIPSQLCQRFGRFLEPAVIGKSSVQNRRIGTKQKL